MAAMPANVAVLSVSGKNQPKLANDTQNGYTRYVPETSSPHFQLHRENIMSVDFPKSSTEQLPVFPLPQLHFQTLREGFLRCNYKKESIRRNHHFTTDQGKLQVNCVAFADDLRWDPDTSSVAVYYDPDRSVPDEKILDRLKFAGAPFVFIARKQEVSPFGMHADGIKTAERLGGDLNYNQIAAFLEDHRVDFDPQKILNVKRGISKFVAFPHLNPQQLRFQIFPITRNVLAANFGAAVNSLRHDISPSKHDPHLDITVTNLAVQLLGGIILLHKGQLPSRGSVFDLTLNQLLQLATKSFPTYFSPSLIEKYHQPAEKAFALLQQASYSSFTPEMLDELYFRAYPDPQQRKQEGRFNTPLYLTRRILDVLPIESLRPSERLLADMTCGWGSFLVAGYERLSKLEDMSDSRRKLWQHILGNDIDPFTAQLARLALLTASLQDSWRVDDQNALTWKPPEGHPTIIVGNPKFGFNKKLGRASTEPSAQEGEFKWSQKADAFLRHSIALLAPGGYLGMIMPQSFTVTGASSEARRELLENCDILEMWDLPLATFEKHAAVSPMVIFARKREHTGFQLTYPVRIRNVQSDTLPELERSRVFTASTIAPSQNNWSISSKRSADSKVTHLIEYHTILSDSTWQRLVQRCISIRDVSDVANGAQRRMRSSNKSAKDPTSKLVNWLPTARDSLPEAFHIKYGQDKISYPDDFLWPRLGSRHLFEQNKVLLVSDPNPSWGKRAKVAIDRRGYIPSHNFWVLVPKSSTQHISVEVLAAVLDWDVSNAWIVESLRYPWIQRRILLGIPFPKLSKGESVVLEKAVREIEAAIKIQHEYHDAKHAIDEVLQAAYGLDKQTLGQLRKVMEWPRHTIGDVRAGVPESRSIINVTGQVEQCDPSAGTITMWFDGIRGVHTLPVVDAMPGWMLRNGGAFRADVSLKDLQNEDWSSMSWWNIVSKEFSYLETDELVNRLDKELA